MKHFFVGTFALLIALVSSATFASSSDAVAPAALNCTPSEDMGNVFYSDEGTSVALDCTGVTYLLCSNHVVCCSASYLASETRFDANQCATLEWLNPNR